MWGGCWSLLRRVCGTWSRARRGGPKWAGKGGPAKGALEGPLEGAPAYSPGGSGGGALVPFPPEKTRALFRSRRPTPSRKNPGNF